MEKLKSKIKMQNVKDLSGIWIVPLALCILN